MTAGEQGSHEPLPLPPPPPPPPPGRAPRGDLVDGVGDVFTFRDPDRRMGGTPPGYDGGGRGARIAVADEGGRGQRPRGAAARTPDSDGSAPLAPPLPGGGEGGAAGNPTSNKKKRVGADRAASTGGGDSQP